MGSGGRGRAAMNGEVERADARSTGPGPNRKRRGWSRWLLWIGVAALVVLIAVAAVVAIMLHRAEPTLRASVIKTMQERFHAHVELDDLHVSVVDGFQVEGSGLRIWLPREALAEDDATQKPAVPKPSAAGKRQGAATGPVDAPGSEAWRSQPWIVVRKMHFHVASRLLRGKPIEVSVIHVEGVRVTLPPKADRPHINLSGDSDTNATGGKDVAAAQNPAQPASQSPRKIAGLFKVPEIEVKRIECNDAQLEILRTQQPGKPPKLPLEFEFSKVTVIPDGKGGPMAFTVDMVNAKPVGDIHSTGHAGPWVPRDPGALPVDGDYSFDHADLSTIKGIAGMLSSTGHYTGTLREIEADGVTETPDFRLERVSGAGEKLTTHFHAVVDGTNGDTRLEPVDAMLGHTHIVARGKVVRAEDRNGVKRGHDIVLDVTIDRGKIEDIEAISSDQMFVTGDLTLHTSFHLPQGEATVWDKLELNGQFHLTEAKFMSDKIQGRLVELSLRGQGKPNEVKAADPGSVRSETGGHFKLGGGMLDLPDLNYMVPGALIAVRGKYGLQDGSLAFDGDAKLDASLSEIIGGWKGLLLIPADKWLHKNGAGTDVPIHITGTRKEPKFGVDFGRLGKNDAPKQGDAPKQPDVLTQ
jgi:hypothetical protein